MATVPPWSAARSGLLGDTGAVDASAQINQFLSTHPMTVLYAGNSILMPNGSGGTAWQYHLDSYDLDQPFTMSGTSIGRVVVPLLAVGTGADLVVSLCADSSGTPGSVITQTRIPANWINSLSAVSGLAGPSSSTPVTQYTGSPLALGQFNSFHTTPATSTPWSFPTIASGMSSINGAQTYSGDYFIAVGGFNGSTVYPNVYTIKYDTAGNLSQAVPQPSMPQANGGGCGFTVVTDPASGAQTLVVAGGNTAVGGTGHTNAVFTAGFDPSTGTVSSWSAQANLPQALDVPGVASWNGYVYLVGGINGANTADLQTVYYAQVQNGQITAWNSGMPFPVAADSMYVAAINGFLVAFGGEPFSGSVYNNCYYAAINADGSLSNWQAGPSLPQGMFQFQVGTPVFGSYGVMAIGNSEAYMLGVSATGLDTGWQTFSLPQGGINLAEVPTGSAGQWQHYGLYYSFYITNTVTLTPRISIPLPATGLTNAATYHIVLQQVGSDLNNYLRTHDDFDVFPGNPTLLTRSKGSTTWTAGTSGHAVPIAIYDQTASGQPLHLWSDNGARIGALVCATTPDQRFLGVLDATSQPGPVLNQWPTFTQGVGLWHATGATLTQSSAQTHGNLPFSGLLTPSGSASLSYAESDLVPVQQGHSYVMSAWYYSPTGYSNVAVSANWFDANRNYLSTTSGTATSIPAGTWTQFQTTVTANVANAVYADMVCVEGGTPPSSALLYVSSATVQDASGPQVSTVSETLYGGTWPSSSIWPPLGTSTKASTGGASWLAANPGQPTLAGQVNQFLSNHNVTYVYTGSQQAAQTTGSAVYSTTSGQYLAQRFTTGSSQTTIGQVLLQVSAVGGSPITPTIPALSLSLYSDNAGTPGAPLGSVVAGEEYIYSSSFWATFPLAVSGLTPSTNYWLVTSPVGTASNYYAVQHSNQVSGASTSTNGSSWTAQSFGLMFQVFTNGTTGQIQYLYEDDGAAWAQFTYNSQGLISALTKCVAGQGGTALMSSRTFTFTNGLLTGVN